jgi:CheY-like chemotaxis protein
MGIRALRAESGEAAIRCLQDQPVDPIISDVRMPGPVDGIGLYRWVVANQPHLASRFLFTSGDLVSMNLDQLFADTVVPRVQKPYRFTLSAAPVYNRHHIPQIVTIATNPAITGIGPWTFLHGDLVEPPVPQHKARPMNHAVALGDGDLARADVCLVGRVRRIRDHVGQRHPEIAVGPGFPGRLVGFRGVDPGGVRG